LPEHRDDARIFADSRQAGKRKQARQLFPVEADQAAA
jgi:hypothetical protein